ncbi:MAG TPA: FAD-dependent oxidoreductase [Gaiellaceae bacterium]|nr:FAD-dependent oxidoreductase [Gaiellaceae bacterium]
MEGAVGLAPPLAAPVPWWLEEARAARGDEPAPPLAGKLEVDVAIVGGGFTGLWTALAVKERRPAATVAVLEGLEVGLGPSGRNGGFLHGWWSSLPALRVVLGDAGALAVARASSAIVPAVREFCSSRGEDVWLREGGLLKVAASAAEAAAVDASVAAARELGVPDEAVPLGEDEVRARCDSPRFRRGVLFRDGATVQPARLALALERAAIDAGVIVHERTPVTRLEPHRLSTPTGEVRARAIVLALNAWTTPLPPAAPRQTNFGSAVVLTEPVPELLAEIGWTGGEAIVDGRMFLHYFRTTADGRVLMGSGSGSLAYGGRVDRRLLDDRGAQARAAEGLRTLLPRLADVAIERSWSGPIDVSADRLPFFGSVPGSGIHYGAGYSGNGVGPSWIGGRILSALALGEEDEWTALPLVGRRPRRLPPEPLRYVGGAAIRAASLSVERAHAAGRRPSPAARAIAAVPRLLRLPLGTR